MPLFNSDIPTITPDKDFAEVRECDYKDEHYSVRDNGAIMRHVREGKPKRKDDEVWSFGKKDDKTGYMIFCGARVHIIVATAFFGERNSKVYVVDHKDTNRCNNRAENLRWLTRLENALNNPATRKKIIFLCGSIENFLNDPSCLRDATGSNQDVMWMRTVSAEEAKAAYARVMEWATKPSSETSSQGGRLGDWIYQPQKDDHQIENNVSEYFETSNILAQQLGWRPSTNPEFPCCPKEVAEHPIQEYADQLAEGKVFVSAQYGDSTVYKYTIHDKELLVITKIPNGVKDYALARVTWNGKAFIHESMGTYVQEVGVMAAFTRAQGLEWDGPDSIDNYC